MKSAIFKGDFLFAVMFAVLGLVWIVGSFDLPLWAGFAPDSGFLPLAYGVILFALSAAVAVMALVNPPDTSEREPLAKSFLILLGLIVGVGLFGMLGFALPLFGMMVFFYCYVERLPVVRSVIVSAATTAILMIVFEYMLAIPLPLHPWDY